MRRLGLVVGGLVGAVLVGACASGPTTPLLLENLTDTPVAIHADGRWVGTYEPGASRSVPLPGEPPIAIEVISPSGAQLVEWGIGADGPTIGAVTSSEVPCGTIRLSVGPIELPSIEPLPPTGPCP